MIIYLLPFSCSDRMPGSREELVVEKKGEEVLEKKEALAVTEATDCSQAKNTCPDYSKSWVDTCPEGQRCVTFKNQCVNPVMLAYQIGCNGDGTAGAPQCNCATGPTIASGSSASFQIVDGDYESCLPSWTPDCLTAGLAVLVNNGVSSCTSGTRLEFTAGNKANPYGKFDSYDIDVEKTFYSIPVEFSPNLECAVDSANHDCRPLWCGSASCPDAYSTPTEGGCADGRSPQAGCQDTFSKNLGYTVTLCPTTCSSESCPSCQDAISCGE